MPTITQFTPCHPDPGETALADFLLAHTEALISAAALLGGQPAVRRTTRLIADVTSSPRLTARTRRGLVDLHRLLALDLVGDSDSLEAACFAAIDPASPVVEEICVLTDTLLSHLRSIAKSEEGAEPWGELFAAA